jgi:hypothetical protein
MTEAEWLACADPWQLLDHLQRAKARPSVRKLRLFACACDRQVWDLLSEERRRLAEAIERRADGEPSSARPVDRPAPDGDVATPTDVYEARVVEAFGPEALTQLRPFAEPPTRNERAVAFRAAVRAAEDATLVARVPAAGRGRRERVARQRQAALVRDIFGNPFRPVAFDPRWRTSDVVELARSIYQDRAFDRLPILADALLDAGCADDAVLGHCRADGPHARGCWVLDAALGRQ